jgi:hypothetical protein
LSERTAAAVTPGGLTLARPVAGLRAAAVSTVVVAFVVSRLVAVGAMVAAGSQHAGRFTLESLWSWDGAWYWGIAETGYGPPPAPHVQTHWPFFPLFPGLARAVHLTGLPTTAAMVLVANMAFVVALVGVHRLARRHLPARAATCAVWVVALFPATAVFSMAYPSSLFLAGSVWAFVLLDEGRLPLAGVAAAVATMARPNGAVVLVALLVAVVLATPRPTPARLVRPALLVCGPAALCFAVWCGLQWHWTGDPFTFWKTKSAWDEVQLWEFARHPHRGEIPHVVLGLFGIGVVVAMARRLPSSWVLLALVYLLPSLLLGIVGMARYANECFPVAMASGVALDRLPASARSAALAVSAVGAAVLAVAIARLAMVP